MFNEFHSSVILFIEVKYFLIPSSTYFPDFRFSTDCPIIIKGFFEFSILEDNLCFPSTISLIVFVSFGKTSYGYVKSPTSPI